MKNFYASLLAILLITCSPKKEVQQTSLTVSFERVSPLLDAVMSKEIGSQLVKTGKVFKAYLGFQLQEVTINPKMKRHYHMHNEKLFSLSVLRRIHQLRDHK